MINQLQPSDHIRGSNHHGITSTSNKGHPVKGHLNFRLQLTQVGPKLGKSHFKRIVLSADGKGPAGLGARRDAKVLVKLVRTKGNLRLEGRAVKDKITRFGRIQVAN